jgi:hypothetical protein
VHTASSESAPIRISRWQIKSPPGVVAATVESPSKAARRRTWRVARIMGTPDLVVNIVVALVGSSLREFNSIGGPPPGMRVF